MAKVDLDNAKKFSKGFSIWVAGMIRVSDSATQSKLASYIGLSQPSLNTRIKGRTPWSLEEFYAVQDYFGEEYKPYENHR